MKLKIKSEKILTELENLGQFVSEAKFSLNENGLETTASDRNMVCVFNLSIPKKDFEVFEVDHKPRDLGIDVSLLLDILKRAKKEVITFDIQEKKMDIIINSIRKFSYSFTEVESDIPDISTLKFTSSFRIKTEDFVNAIGDGDLVGDAVEIKTEDNKILFTTKGEILETETEILQEVVGKATALYPLDYLKKLKFNSDFINVEFGDDYPIRLSFRNCWIVIAPRINEEEESEEKEEIPTAPENVLQEELK